MRGRCHGSFRAILLSIILSATGGVQAQVEAVDTANKASLSTVTPQAPAIEKPKTIALESSLRGSSNLISDRTHGHQSRTELLANLWVGLGETFSATILQGLSKSHQGDEELDLTNTRIGVRHTALRLHRDAKMRNGIFGRLPTNRKTREQDKLQGALGLENLLEIRLGQGPIVINNNLAIVKNFHEYNVNASGTPTLEWRLLENISLTGEITEQLSISAGMEYVTSRTYRGITKSQLEISEEIAWSFSKDVSAAIGHTNGGDLVSSTERASNIEAFDQQTSTVYGELRVSF